MVKMLKKIVVVKKPLKKNDVDKIESLFKQYTNGTIEFCTSFSEFSIQNTFADSLEEMEVLLTSDSIEELKQLEKDFDSKIKEILGDKVKILSSNKSC